MATGHGGRQAHISTECRVQSREYIVKVAQDIMEKRVVTVAADSPLLAVYRLFVQEDISGAPVVDETGEVVGVISARDLLRIANETHDDAVMDLHYYEASHSFAPEEWMTDIEEFEDRLTQRSVAQVMTTGAISVTRNTPINEIADLFLKHRIHRVLVLDQENDDGPLVGLVSVFDMVSLLR
jgi:CBS domain-containing protein